MFEDKMIILGRFQYLGLYPCLGGAGPRLTGTDRGTAGQKIDCLVRDSGDSRCPAPRPRCPAPQSGPAVRPRCPAPRPRSPAGPGRGGKQDWRLVNNFVILGKSTQR